MNRNRHPMQRLLQLARLSRARATQPPGRSPGEVTFFARRIAVLWCKSPEKPDPLRLWELVGRWSLAPATAIMMAAAIWQPGPPPSNPLAPFIIEPAADAQWFELLP